jgi:hypothetical protein
MKPKNSLNLRILPTALRNDSFMKRPLGNLPTFGPVDAVFLAHHRRPTPSSERQSSSQGKRLTGSIVAFTLGPTQDVRQNGFGSNARWEFYSLTLELILKVRRCLYW